MAQTRRQCPASPARELNDEAVRDRGGVSFDNAAHPCQTARADLSRPAIRGRLAPSERRWSHPAGDLPSGSPPARLRRWARSAVSTPGCDRRRDAAARPDSFRAPPSAARLAASAVRYRNDRRPRRHLRARLLRHADRRAFLQPNAHPIKRHRRGRGTIAPQSNEAESHGHWSSTFSTLRADAWRC